MAQSKNDAGFIRFDTLWASQDNWQPAIPSLVLLHLTNVPHVLTQIFLFSRITTNHVFVI